MREICTSGSEGGASQTNGTSLPLFDLRPLGTGNTKEPPEESPSGLDILFMMIRLAVGAPKQHSEKSKMSGLIDFEIPAF